MRNDAPLVAVIIAIGLSLVLATAPADALTFSEIPSYYSQLDFNLTSPTALTTAAGGYANPAVYRMMPGSEIEYYWSDPKDDPIAGLNKWGLFTGTGSLGFGVVHERRPSGDGTLSVTDYRLALAFGSANHSAGLALGWSRGDTEQFGRTTVVQLGMVERYGKHVSLGVAGVFSTEKGDQSGLVDLAVRPMGDDRLTVFGDLEYAKGAKLSNAPWSVGAMLEVPSGVKLIGRYFEGDRFSFALAYTFGGGVGTGFVRASGNPQYNKDGGSTGVNWGVRLGYAERNSLMENLFKQSHYMRMHLKGPVVHSRFRFFDRGLTFQRILAALEGARTDPRVSGVALNLSGTQVSRGNAWEIREKLLQLQREGKHVVVFIDQVGMTLYHLASAADRVVMDPEGMIILPGYAMGRTYLTNLVEKLGIGIDEWRFKEYKSALESLTRHGMTPEDREQRQDLVDQYYRTMRADVASSRGVDERAVDRWVDDLTIMLAQTAMEEGLVDTLGRWDDVRKVIAELEGEGKSLIGSRALASNAYPSKRWGEPPRVALVYAIGPCAMDSGINARRLERILAGLKGDRRVKAVVLRVNSPGGSGLASDVVAAAVKSCSEVKPVIISQGDVAASGGYWISMNGTEILAQPATITGSIGVIGAWVWDKGLGEKIGLESDFVKAGEHADLFFNIRMPLLPVSLPHRPLTEEERERVLSQIGRMYDGFVGKVASARGMTPEETDKISRGRVWTGVQGVDNGLVDRIGGLENAIEVARERAGIPAGEEVKLVEYGRKGLFNPNVFARSLPFLARWRDAELPEDEMAFLLDYRLLYLRSIIAHNGRPLYLLPPDFLPEDAESGTKP